MKIRLTFKTKSELDKLLESFQSNFDVISISKEYANKNSSEKRIYIELDTKKE